MKSEYLLYFVLITNKKNISYLLGTGSNQDFKRKKGHIEPRLDDTTLYTPTYLLITISTTI